MDNAGLRFGDMDIFHYFIEEGDGESIFSVANLVEPGTFNLENLDEMSTPGLTLFLKLPGPVEDIKAFDGFIDVAMQLKESLGAELRDKKRNILSKQMIGHMREEILADTLKRRMNSAGV
jgi:cell division protein ZipA